VAAAQGLDVKQLKRTLRKRTSLDHTRTKGEKDYSRELAKAVHRAVKKWMRIFELPRWPVFIFEEKSLPVERNRQAIATIRIEDSANEVYIQYRNTLAPEAIDHIIAHELGHWVLSNLWGYLFDILDEKQWDAVKSMMEHIIETYTIALVRPDRKHMFDAEIDLGTEGEVIKRSG